MLKKLNDISNKFELTMDNNLRIRTGSFFTDISLTNYIVEQLINRILKDKKDIINFKILEPCVGSGNFVLSFLYKLLPFYTKKEIIKILNNIYAADSNLNTIELYKSNLSSFAKEYLSYKIPQSYFETNVGTALLFDLNNSTKYINISDAFPFLKEGTKFDIVMTNPPYKSLRAEKKHYNNDVDFQDAKNFYKNVNKKIRKQMKHSTQGVLNIYKIFIEEILVNYSNYDAYVSLLVPSTIMTDLSSSELRKYIFESHKLLHVEFIPEGNNYINAQQALAIVHIKTNGQTNNFKIIKNHFQKDEYIIMKKEEILIKNPLYTIFALNKEEKIIYDKIVNLPRIGELPFIKNLRGELDLTIFKKYVISKPTELRLIRGRNIDYYKLTLFEEDEFVDKNFLRNKKNDYSSLERIACQQISNLNSDRRLKFTLIPKDMILGNSANFVIVDTNIFSFDLYALLGILNSRLINWFFKIFSSNNHVNNYEIDALPIPLDYDDIQNLSFLVKEYIQTKENRLIEEIDKEVLIAYGLRER